MKKSKLNNLDLSTILLFVLTPILSFPITLHSVYSKRPIGLVLFVALISIISFLYVPQFSNDKSVYLSSYDLYKSFNINDFKSYLIFTSRPDFLLHALIYGFAKIGIPSNFIFFVSTFLTTGIIYKFFFRLTKSQDLSRSHYFLLFLLVTFSLSLPDLFSGIRFYLAISFLLISYYLISFKSAKISSLFYVMISPLIHFSSLIFIPIIALLNFKPFSRWYFWLFICSIPIILIPSEFIVNIASSMNLTSGLDNKINVYLMGDDFILKGIETGSSNYYWIYLISNIWIYFGIGYLIISRKKYNITLTRNILYLSITCINITYSFPTVYARYLLLVKILFTFVLIEDFLNGRRNRKPIYLFLSLFLLSFIFQVIILRTNFTETLFNLDVLHSVTIFTKEVGISDLN